MILIKEVDPEMIVLSVGKNAKLYHLKTFEVLPSFAY